MSSSENFGRDFSRLVPGFDFLQGLLKNAGSKLPSMGQWVAPTLNPEELEKRIQELKTVQFWLEQNARILGTTIQAMEVQRMTLNTLHSMNMPLADLANALKIQMPDAMGFGPAAVEPSAAPLAPAAPVGPPPPPPGPAAAAANASTSTSGAKKGTGAAPSVDPVQWWRALTEQFGQLAAQAAQSLTESGAAGGGDSAGKAAGKAADGAATQAATKAKSSSAKAASQPAKKAAKASPASGAVGARSRAGAAKSSASKTRSRRAG